MMDVENPLKEEFDKIELIYNQLIQFFVDYSMQVVGALIILIIGYLLANRLSNSATRMLVSRNLDVTLSQLVGSIVYFVVLFCFVVVALGKFGISITPFIAALGAFSLGAGLAIQGIIGNYGAGFSIIFTRPFVVGNTLTVQGVSGVVEEIRLAYTVLRTEDGEQITIPNKEIIGHILENSYEHRLVETTLTLAPGTNPEAAIETLKNALAPLEFVAKEPAAQLGIDAFTHLGIKLGVRVWVPTKSYFDCKYQVNAAIHQALEQAGMTLAIHQPPVTLES